MNIKSPVFHWASQKLAHDCETIDCKEYDTYKDYRADSSGYYILVKTNFEHYRIEVAICNKNHEIVKIFSGRKTQDVYQAIFDYEKKNKAEWFKEKSHIAYLGKELKKAEIALAMGNSAYFQE